MLIGLSGPKRVGKSTVARELSKLTGYPVAALADPIKYFFRVLWDFNHRHEDGDLKEVYHQCMIPQPWQIANALTELSVKYGISLTMYGDVHRRFLEVFAPHIEPARPPHAYRVTPRLAYQLFGTEVMKHFDRDIWLRGLRDNTIYADVRFTEEAAAIRARGGLVVHVVSKRAQWSGEHASECGPVIHPHDITFINDLPINDERAQAALIAIAETAHESGA